MSKINARLCDVCGKPTRKIAFKLYRGAFGSKRGQKDYSHHADVGECCAKRVEEIIRWQERMTNGAGKRVQHNGKELLAGSS